MSSFAPAADRAACCVIQVMKTMHEEMEARVDGAGDDVAADMEKEVHAIGSCLKVRIVLRAFHPCRPVKYPIQCHPHACAGSAPQTVCTTFAVDGIEQLRRACGGHGFSMFSGTCWLAFPT